MRKLVSVIINVTLMLVNFINLTIEYASTPFKRMTRNEPKTNYTPKDSRPRSKTRRKTSIRRLRHWKENTHTSWDITKQLRDHPFKTSACSRGGGVKNLPNLPTDSTKKVPTVGG